MGGMSTDRPPADDAAGAAAAGRPVAVPETVEWGGDGRRRRRLPRWLTGLRGDRRIPPVAAGLGAVALALSVLSEWQVTTLVEPLFGGGPEEVERRTMTTGLVDLGGWAGGYIAGAIVLVGAVTLALFGPRPGRAYARLVAVSTGAVLVVLVAALIGELADTTFALPDWVILQADEDQLAMTRGRGGWCALVGVLFLAGAAWLAKVPAGRAPESTGGPAAAADEDPDDWPWRRPGGAPQDPDDERPAPLDLSVGPAAPFTALPGDRDARDDGDNGRSPWRGEGR